MSVQNEFQLLKERRFLPLFTTQFLGAMNDNLYKNALIILIAFGIPLSSVVNQNTLINLCAALFILPYFLFSAFAGQLADKFEKSSLISIVKCVEIIVACLAILGFYFNHLILLLSALFLLGTQATFFGPLKYSILPQHLEKTELIGGNGLIEMGTFLAILLGTMLGAILIGLPIGVIWVSAAMLMLAILGFLSSLWIPKAASQATNLKVDWNIFKQTFGLVKNVFHDPVIFYVIIGISWFWLYGSIFLTQIANYTKTVLGGDEHVTTLLLMTFSVGIGLGSVLCEWLSSKKIELGFVFIGCIGLTLFALDLSFSNSTLPNVTLNPWAFFTYEQNYRIVFDSLLMGAFGGLYLVPLYTLLQTQSSDAFRSRTIAANNIINAIFMVGASLLAILVLNLGFSIPTLFMLTAILNAVVGVVLIRLKMFLKGSTG